jgi:hypothetical protein
VQAGLLPFLKSINGGTPTFQSKAQDFRDALALP